MVCKPGLLAILTAVFISSVICALLFTHDSDAFGNAMPMQGAGGVAFIDVFGSRTYVSKYSGALVYYTNLSTTPGNHGDASFIVTP